MRRYLFSLLFVLIGLPALRACSCYFTPYFADIVSNSETLVFRGKILEYFSATPNEDYHGELPLMKVAVTEHIQGPEIGADTILFIGQDGLNCAELFPIDAEGEAIFSARNFRVFTDEDYYGFDRDLGFPLTELSFCGRFYLDYSAGDGGLVEGPILPGINGMSYENFVKELSSFYDFNSREDVWLPIGTSWVYATSRDGESGQPVRMEIVGDTLIDGRYCRTLERDQPVCDGRPERDHYCMEDDRLYLYDQTEAAFFQVYDFRAAPGDTITVPLWPSLRGIEPYGDTLFYRVENTGYFMDDRERYYGYREISYGYRNPNGEIHFADEPENLDTLIENFGGANSLIPSPLVDPDCVTYRPDGLRCYWRGDYPDTLNLVDNQGLCLPVSSRNYRPSLPVEVFPNPVRGTLNIRLANPGQYEIRIVDAVGRTVFYQSDFVNGIARINTHKLPAGIYFLRVSSSEGESVKRLVME